MTFTAKVQPYKMYEYSWTTNTPTNHEIDLGGLANTFAILDGPDDLAVRLNSSDNDLIEYAGGVDDVIINKILITSATQNESVAIYAAWEE